MCWHRNWLFYQNNKGAVMKKNIYSKKDKASFFDDTFSYLNLESSDSEALYEEEREMNNLLEDYNIEDLDITDLDDNYNDEILFT